MTRIIQFGTVLLNLIYALFKLLPQKNKVTMISRQSNKPSFEFEMIRDEIYSRNQKTEVVFLCRTLDGGVNSTIFTKFGYCFHMLVQMYHIATSRVVILDTYCIVISLLKHKKSLKVIQMWHSMGTMKMFGYSATDTAEGTNLKLARAMKMHENYDYVFASAEAYKDHLAAGFGCDRSIIETMPLPRLDLLMSKEYEASIREKIYQAYPMLKEKKVVVYCPTFRKDETGFEEALEKLADAMDLEKFHFVAKLHPLSKVEPSEKVFLAKEFSSFDMLFVADYVISDYSCIVYEAAVRGIPLFFYNYDWEFYKDGRGLAIDYEHELPGIISQNPAVIAQAVKDAEVHNSYDHVQLKAFADKYVEPTEHATKDIVDFVYRFID